MIQKLESLQLRWEPKATATIISYAIPQERCGETRLFDAILHFTNMYFKLGRSSTSLLDFMGSEPFTRASPRAIILVAPYLGLGEGPCPDAEYVISKWSTAISVALHVKEVAGSVVDTLLQIAANPQLRPLIPADFWLWLNERPSLPPFCRGRWSGGDRDVVRTIRALNDVRILTSYLILVWSEWEYFYPDALSEMRASIREDFNGIGMGSHRAELIQRLDYILGELDRQPEFFYDSLEEMLWYQEVGHRLPAIKDEYGRLKRILQEVDEEATEILNRMLHNFIFLSLLTLIYTTQDPTPSSRVPCLSRVHDIAFGTLRIIPS
jgi:hypothetical protein